MSQRPAPPIELTGQRTRLRGPVVEIPSDVRARLGAACPSGGSEAELAEASRDWWPLAMHWALQGEVAQRARVVCRPTTVAQAAEVLSICNTAGIPVTTAAGRSGVCGGTVPVFGGVVLDVTLLAGGVVVDEVSGVVEVYAGTFGPELEHMLADQHGLSVGHFPQSFDISTVGGWVACRGAGQYSTRYGKIEHMVVGLEVVLADGTVVRTGGAPAAAVGPDLGQLFIGCEGTLGVITRVWLRTHPVPAYSRSAAYALGSFEEGLETCRRIIRRGATPAVLRLYDPIESQRGHGGDGQSSVLLVLDEGPEEIVEATMHIVTAEIDEVAADRLGAEPVERWLEHRNDTSALQALTRRGFVVDTLEIAAPWSRLEAIYTETLAALRAVPHARLASCHLSHSYSDGACLYFTFAATPPPDDVDSTYVALWDAGQRAVLAAGGNLSHHHGVGLNRSRFVAEALGPAYDVLVAVKQALDPNGILNPGKLGLPSRFGSVGWP